MARAKVLQGKTIKLKTGCGNIFVTLNFDGDGNPNEVFARLGKSGGCPSSQCEAIGRLITLLLREKCSVEKIVNHLKGISCHNPIGLGANKVTSCADAIGKALEELCNINNKPKEDDIYAMKYLEKDEDTSSDIIKNNEKVKEDGLFGFGACPECGGKLMYSEGCATCLNCGFSKCG